LLAHRLVLPPQVLRELSRHPVHERVELDARPLRTLNHPSTSISLSWQRRAVPTPASKPLLPATPVPKPRRPHFTPLTVARKRGAHIRISNERVPTINSNLSLETLGEKQDRYAGMEQPPREDEQVDAANSPALRMLMGNESSSRDSPNAGRPTPGRFDGYGDDTQQPRGPQPRRGNLSPREPPNLYGSGAPQQPPPRTNSNCRSNPRLPPCCQGTVLNQPRSARPQRLPTCALPARCGPHQWSSTRPTLPNFVDVLVPQVQFIVRSPRKAG
jgi:hypothetical protein